jgi:hypothetical protein
MLVAMQRQVRFDMQFFGIVIATLVVSQESKPMHSMRLIDTADVSDRTSVTACSDFQSVFSTLSVTTVAKLSSASALPKCLLVQRPPSKASHGCFTSTPAAEDFALFDSALFVLLVLGLFVTPLLMP